MGACPIRAWSSQTTFLDRLSEASGASGLHGSNPAEWTDLNWKPLILLGTLLFGALPAMRAVEPIGYQEIAMLLRNGEDPQFIINDAVRRKLLQPLSTEEEKTLLSLHATPALVNLLRDPAIVVAPQAAADYAAQVEQRKAQARLAEREEQLRAQRDADASRLRPPTNPPVG